MERSKTSYSCAYFQAGSVHVRVRRDADEQMVLAHVYHRLSNLINVLTVQIFKDDWSHPSALQILGDTSLLNQFSSASPTYPGVVSNTASSFKLQLNTTGSSFGDLEQNCSQVDGKFTPAYKTRASELTALSPWHEEFHK